MKGKIFFEFSDHHPGLKLYPISNTYSLGCSQKDFFFILRNNERGPEITRKMFSQRSEANPPASISYLFYGTP